MEPQTIVRKDGSVAQTYGDKRGYSWPPFEKGNTLGRKFEKGNTLGVRHGANSEAILSERASELRERLLETYEFLGAPVFNEALERYVRAEARSQLLHDWAMKVASGQIRTARVKSRPQTGIEAVPPYIWSEISRAESNAQKFAQDLGLDPIGLARIAKELGWAKQLAAGRVQDRIESLRRLGNELRSGR